MIVLWWPCGLVDSAHHTTQLLWPDSCCSYLVQLRLSTGEGESKANRQLFVLDILLLHEVSQAFGHMVKQLQHKVKTTPISSLMYST